MSALIEMIQAVTPEDLLRIEREDPELAAEILRHIELSGSFGLRRPYIEALHPRQRQFVDDPAKKKSACTSRRAGKTEGVAAWLLEGGEKAPGGLSVYIALTRNSCRKILWNTLLGINRRFDLKLWFREVDGQLTVQLPNKHQIWLAGCEDASQTEKFRGVRGELLSGYTNAAIDEGQAYGPHMRELIDNALEPALMDQDGGLALTGTPGAVPTGYFYGAATGDWSWTKDEGPEWSKHHWTVLDNPYIPQAAEWLARKRLENKWDDNHPTYVREWKGLYILDGDALVYPYNQAINSVDRLPEGAWRRMMGVDLGVTSPSTFVIGAMRDGHPEQYIEHAEGRTGLTPNGVEAHVERLVKEYNIELVVVDAGGLGIGYVNQMKLHGLPVMAAEKKQKLAFQKYFAGDMKSGKLKVIPSQCRPLLDEWALLQWSDDRTEEDDRFANHYSDAALYLSRAMNTYYAPMIDTPPLDPEFAMEMKLARARIVAKRRLR